jgi:hypothetical protein
MKYNKDNVAVAIVLTSIAIIIWYLATGYTYVEEKVKILEGGDIQHAIETKQY